MDKIKASFGEYNNEAVRWLAEHDKTCKLKYQDDRIKTHYFKVDPITCEYVEIGIECACGERWSRHICEAK